MHCYNRRSYIKGEDIQMKKVLKQIRNALGYFAVYFVIQNIISAIAGFVVVAKYSTELGAARSVSFEHYMTEYQKYLAGYNGICLIATAIAVLLTYFIIEKVKKSSLAKETDIRKVSGMHIGLTIIAATGAMFFLNFMLNILPIPKELLGSLHSGMKTFRLILFGRLCWLMRSSFRSWKKWYSEDICLTGSAR